MVTITVPLAGLKLMSFSCEVTLKVFPAVALPEVLAVVPRFPPKLKSMLVATAALGSAIANKANKTTRLIMCSSVIQVVQFFLGEAF